MENVILNQKRPISGSGGYSTTKLYVTCASRPAAGRYCFQSGGRAGALNVICRAKYSGKRLNRGRLGRGVKALCVNCESCQWARGGEAR